MKRNTTLTLLLAMFTLSLLFALPNATEAVDETKVEFYMHANYDTDRDEPLIYTKDDDNNTFDQESGDNTISDKDLRSTERSASIPGGQRDWHNEISSLRVFGGAAVILYSGDNYSGSSVTYTSDQSNLSNNSFNDKASSLMIFFPDPLVSSSDQNLSLDPFYLATRAGATDYNETQDTEFTLTNAAHPDTTLYWEITDADAILNFSPSSGTVDGQASVTITVWANPTSSGADSGSFTIETSNGDETINWSLTAYDTPSAPSQVAPALGSNGRVNLGSGESRQFEVLSGNPSFPDASLKGYQWQTQREGIAADSNAWDPSTGNGSAQRQISLADVDNWTVYVRMMDNNDVATEPIEIPVAVWNRPVIASAPPTGSSVINSSWFTDTYVGVVGQAAGLHATSNTEPTLSATGLTTASKVGSGAGEFDGTGGTDINAGSGINLANQSMTVSAWIKRDRTGTNEWVISQGQATANLGLVFGFRSSNQFALSFFGGNALNVTTAQAPEITDTTNWHHWVGTYDADSGERKVYLDGSEVASDIASANYQGSGNLWIGSLFGASDFFDGNIDDVGIFNRALSDAEITDLADATSFGLTGRPDDDDLEDSLVYLNTFDYDGPSDNSVGRYLWFDSSDFLIATQLPGGTVDVTFSQKNLSGSLSCVAVTNHGIESDKQVFDLKVYPTLTVDVGGPYVGKPLEVVTLSSSANETGYPSSAFSYQWEVDMDGDGVTDNTLTASNDPQTEYTWSVDGEYAVALTVTVTTQEGLVITASDTGTVTLEAGVPTALPGGPYRGGISGGNFSPIQLEGNPPDFIEDADVGLIDSWLWSVGPTENGLTFDGSNDYIEVTDYKGVTGTTARTVMAWIRTSSNGAIASWGVNTTGNKWIFRVQSTNGIAGAIRVEVEGGYIVGNTFVRDGQWHHVAAVLPDVVSPDVTDVLLYVDGVLEATSALNSQTIDTTIRDVWIGNDHSSRYFNGEMDDIAIFDSALEASEIAEIMDSAPSGKSDLVAYWPFEEGSGTTTADVSGHGNDGTFVGDPQFFGTITENDIYNPTREYQIAGEYDIGLIVTSVAGKSSPLASTTITVIDGTIEGQVKAADLRTPVEAVTITLTSSHVDTNALSLVAVNNTDISTTADGSGLSAETDEERSYSFPNLPLGSYVLVASKGTGDDAHEFETKKQVTELTLDAPNQLAIDYTDLSVFPVGGQIYYSILKNGAKVYVPDVEVSAQPVGNASAIDALDSTTALDAKSQNYSMPLFAGQYLFKPTREGHEVRLVGTTPSEGAAIGSTPSGYDADTQLITIEDARTDIDFVDYTTRTITVIVEDSGGFPIETNTDGNQIEVSISGTNGAADGTVVDTGQATFTAEVPPGVYTIELPNVPTAIVKGDSSQKTAELDVTGGDGEVTMVVPVQIELSIGPAPTLFGVNDDFLEDIGLTDADNPEGFMFYYAPKRQEHIYTITATANGNSVADFTLEITDDISQESFAPAPTVTQSVTDGSNAAQYTVIAGIPNSTVVDEDNPETYVLDADGNKVPKVLPKTITFKAFKDNYSDSELEEFEVTVIGDLPEGSVSEFVSIPNVNYFVLHDPPGDKSYSYFDESMTIKGLLKDMTITVKDGRDIRVFPSPWRNERTIDDVDFDDIADDDQDLGTRGLLGNQDFDSAGLQFLAGAAAEGILGTGRTILGPLGYAAQIIALPAATAILSLSEFVQYEVSPNRFLRTPMEDEIDDLPDKMGPGKGDIYYGEGWTLGLQTKYRLGIKLDTSGEWVPDTALILTYDILDVNNQYVYTVTDIERIIEDLQEQIDLGGEPAPGSNEETEQKNLISARDTWQSLLAKNPAYVWRTEHIEGDGDSDREALDQFLETEYGDADRELLLFNGGTEFEYSRTMTEIDTIEYSSEISIGTEGTFEHYLSTESGVKIFGNGASVNFELGTSLNLGTTQILDKARESGTESEQTVGFVLADGDLWDSFATYVYEGPWGTPIFFTDPGSVTSWPWQQGTVKGIDVKLELISAEDNGPFDYRDGAHYQFKVTSEGKAVKEGSGFRFIFYDLPIGNPKSATVKFNGSHADRYLAELFKGFSGTDLITGVQNTDGIGVASANITVSIYPPEKDWNNAGSFEYPVVVQSESEGDYQIAVNKVLRPIFADLRAPRATVTAPYDGQRISPTLFTDADFAIEVYSDDEDVAQIQLQIRTKQPDGVFEPWQNISGVLWEDGGTNDNVTVVTHTNRDPQRREFTLSWTESEITTLGVGEYQLRAVAQDAATQLSTDGTTQTDAPNVDLDPPVITFRVDNSEPTVLTTIPFYQDKDSERIYRGELSATFTDDMTADDFSDRTFEVVDLLNNSSRVAGFVSYSPTLRQAIFVPVTPFDPNGFYKATVKTDTYDDNDPPNLTESGVHDLAGNPLDLEFSWTFRTTDSFFEEKWSIALSVTDASSTDANKIAAVAFGALDSNETNEDGTDDELDARAVPRLDSQISLSFLDSALVEFDRDTRPADGRLGHHWFFVVDNATGDATVDIEWLPSLKLTRTTRQYQVIQLVEFDSSGAVTNTIPLDPVGIDPDGSPVTAYSYTAVADESRTFRLDVMKANIVATEFTVGSSGWKFFSAPITPERADPFVNFGDDIDGFQMFKYVTSENTYKIYPLDLGEVSLQTGHGYFTRLTEDVEVDVGGAANNSDVTLTLDVAGWHAIGNPFILPVDIDSLLVNGTAFNSSTDVQTTLYRWNVDAVATDAYATVTSNADTATGDALQPWEGYFIKTLVDNVSLTIPADSTALANATVDLPDSFDPPAAPPVVQQLQAGEFELRFALTAEKSADLITSLGTREKAADGYDRFDQSEPPRLKGTASVYFDHTEWDEVGGRYNTDFKPTLEVGETANWTVSVFTDEPNASMRLSWEDAIGKVSDDILVEFHEADGEQSPEAAEGGDWRDMRAEKSVEIESNKRRTNVRYEVRATRIALAPIADLSVVAGEAQVKLNWKASDNPYIEGYTVYRQAANDSSRFTFDVSRNSFTDKDVEEEMTYTYQVGVRFSTGVIVKSELFSVKVMPLIKETVLMHNYPNPFNPETWIPYELSKDVDVTIDIYGVNGQRVRSLDLGFQSRGRYTSRDKAAYWDGRNYFGEKTASGVYFYVFTAGEYTKTMKMVIVK